MQVVKRNFPGRSCKRKISEIVLNFPGKWFHTPAYLGDYGREPFYSTIKVGLIETEIISIGHSRGTVAREVHRIVGVPRHENSSRTMGFKYRKRPDRAAEFPKNPALAILCAADHGYMVPGRYYERQMLHRADERNGRNFLTAQSDNPKG